MARNIEIKAYVTSIAAITPLAAALATEAPVTINQDDIFFNCPNGRLKLRILSETHGQLVFYKRANQTGPKQSYYQVSETSSPQSLLLTLTDAYGQIGRVIKQRTIYMHGRTRIHLDKVQDLGEFMELEVVLTENESAEDGIKEAVMLMQKLGVQTAQLIDGAYHDLLLKNRHPV